MNQETVDLLIIHGLVVTVDGANRIWRDGAVAISGSRIVDVGASDQLAALYAPRQTIDASRKLVMPGLIDTYHHAGHGMMKGMRRTGMHWPGTRVFFHGSTLDWWHAEGLLTAVERVKFGVTTGVTIVGATPARADDPAFAEQNARAVEQVGTRSFIAVGPPDPGMDYLPRPWSGSFFEDGRWVERPFTYEQTIEVSKEVFRRLEGRADGRIRTMLAIPNLCGINPQYTPSRRYYPYSTAEGNLMGEKVLEARQIADDFGVMIHTHGGKGIFHWAESLYGEKVLREVLGPDVIFAHMNGLTDHDIRVLQETDCAVAAVPFGAGNTLHGTCPMVKLIQNGVRVAISTDGSAPFHHTDLFLGLHRAMYLQWMEQHDRSLLPPGKTLRLVTIEAAAALGIDREVGSLEPGKKADIILVDLNQPHLVPFEDPANMIAWYVRGNDVDTTIVDGIVLMANGTVLTVDEQSVLDRAREEIRKSFERVDVSRYVHHHEDFWLGWREVGPEPEE